MLRQGVTGFWKKDAEVNCRSHHIVSRVHTINMISLLVDFDHVAAAVFVRFPQGILTLSSPFHIVFFGRKSPYSAHTYRVGSHVPPSEGVIST